MYTCTNTHVHAHQHTQAKQREIELQRLAEEKDTERRARVMAEERYK
jgi:hypothetical protein